MTVKSKFEPIIKMIYNLINNPEQDFENIENILFDYLFMDEKKSNRINDFVYL